jgi:hypothetical protein
MDKNSLCVVLCVLSIYKKEGARAWGWQRSPNKNEKTLLPPACAVTERSEKRINSNATHFFLRGFAAFVSQTRQATKISLASPSVLVACFVCVSPGVWWLFFLAATAKRQLC